ncbi:hypothetical protein CWS01_07620 [Niallia nealsonii]|uniref:Uncharacterized protein n=1 Tax=Niallia nealsonii TaxID=115979 RepID=A0A2N0Z492_9BACI|nr:hypothetical protein CWS01_07620 [Niallia nealsonii]
MIASLIAETSSASTIIFYQPKAPKK